MFSCSQNTPKSTKIPENKSLQHILWKLKNSKANFIWFLTPKHFPCRALEAQLICALKIKKLNKALVTVSKNVNSFLLNGQISVPEWCVNFFWNTLSFIKLQRCHALSLQQHKNYQKKKVFLQQRYLLLPPSPRWKPIALMESGKFDMLTPSLAHWNKTVHSNYFSTLVKWPLYPRTAPWRWQKHPTYFRL